MVARTQTTPPFVAHCLELLAGVGPVRTRPMFGGHGFYAGDVFFALVAYDRLYLKADAASAPRFVAAGGEPFVVEMKGRATTMGYFSAPEEAVDSAQQMTPWARLALQAALAARAPAARPSTTRAAKKTATKTGTKAAKKAAGKAAASPAPAGSRRSRLR